MSERNEPVIPSVAIPVRIWIVTPALVALGVGLVVGAMAPGFGGAFFDAVLGGVVSGVGITAGGLAITPWKTRKMNELAPILLGSQMLTFFAIIALGGLVWYRLKPDAGSFGFGLACGFLPGLLIQAKGFAGVVAGAHAGGAGTVAGADADSGESGGVEANTRA